MTISHRYPNIQKFNEDTLAESLLNSFVYDLDEVKKKLHFKFLCEYLGNKADDSLNAQLYKAIKERAKHMNKIIKYHEKQKNKI